jgi:hypothetical protein
LQPVRTLALAIVISLLGGCAQLPGTGAAVSAKQYTAMSFTVSVKGAQVRRVQQAAGDPISDVLASHVKTVAITLQDTAAGSPPATVATIVNFDQTESAVTFTNLEPGHFYQVTCRALGTDPNGDNPADPTADLTDPDVTLSTAYLDVPALVGGTADQDVSNRLTDANKQPLAVQKLPLTLYTPIFRGHGQAGVDVAGGGIVNTEDDVTVDVASAAIALAPDTGTMDRLGFWNFLSLDNTGSNANRSNDAHLTLRLYGLAPNSRISKISLTDKTTYGAAYTYDSVGYEQGHQFIGVYDATHTAKILSGVPQDLSTLGMAVTGTTMTLNLYVDRRDQGDNPTPFPLPLPAGATIDVTVQTTAGTISLTDVTL